MLRPGGRLVLALYRRYSAFHLFDKLLFQGIVRGDLRRLGYQGLMSTVEHGADGVRIAPLVKTYTGRQLRRMLADYSSVEVRPAHYRRDHLPLLGRFVPTTLEVPLDRALGWYIVAFARR